MKKKWLYALLFICCYSSYGYAQEIKGIVVDAKTSEVLQSVTVFISGTTKGTSTDENGRFILKNVKFPCELSVSMVGYKREALSLEEAPSQSFKFLLQEQDIDLGTVQVQGKNNRSKNIIDFENNFLGQGLARGKASLSNNTALFFNVKKEKRTFGERSFYRRFKMEVTAKELLEVQSPSLGYNILVDLKYFELKYGRKFSESDTISYFGYYYFKPSQKITKRIVKNRKRAYYNSRLHFLRSLFGKKLAENGYVVMEVLEEEQTRKTKYVPFDIYKYMSQDDKGNALFQGLEGKLLSILFYDKRGVPRNLSKKKAKGQPFASPLYLTNNSILVTPEGLNPDNGMLFGGVIGNKKVGAILPLDYYPPSKD